MTLKEVLKDAVRTLEGVRVPAGLAEDIALPVFAVIQNLNRCVDAMDEAEAAEEAEEIVHDK